MLTKFIPYLRFAPYAGIALFALAAAVQYGNARHWEKRYISEAKAHSATVAAYTTAQRVAGELNKAKVERIEREYEIAGQKAEAEYEKLIASNRANLDKWLRSKGAGGKAGSGATGQAAPMPSESVQGTETAIVPVADLEIVADAYAQLDALRAWALEVGKVD